MRLMQQSACDHSFGSEKQRWRRINRSDLVSLVLVCFKVRFHAVAELLAGFPFAPVFTAAALLATTATKLIIFGQLLHMYPPPPTRL